MTKSAKNIAMMTVVLIVCAVFLLFFSDEPTEMGMSDAGAIDLEYKESDGSYTTEDYAWLTQGNTAAEKRAYTIFVLMNGTDLESKGGCATSDLQEILKSGYNTDEVNVLLMTGGTAQWKNNAIPQYTAITYVNGNSLVELANLGSASIVDYKTVSAFIDYGMDAFPADKYGFVFWNHGGGTLGGYGSDELNKGASMTVKQIGSAFGSTQAGESMFEFIGFDCCLMATAEIALYLRPYANYLIASEELEPGNGWDYNWLKGLSDNSGANGAEIGRLIADMFVTYYKNSDWEATLSVIDLNNIETVIDRLNDLSGVAESAIYTGDFRTISKARKGTKSFAVSAPEEDSYDLVDIKHFAIQLEDDFPYEAAALMSSVEEAVVYYRNSDNVKNAYGLSTYFPYLAKRLSQYGVPFYERMDSDIGAQTPFIGFMGAFTQELNGAKAERPEISRAKPLLADDGEVSIKLSPEVLEDINEITFVIWKQLEEGSDYFIKLGLDTNVEIAADGTINTMFDGYWATLGGKTACFYELESAEGVVKYSSPAVLNGEEVKLILMFDDKNPEGKLIGAIPLPPEGSMLASKNIIPINKGDTLALKYFVQLFVEDEADIAQYDEASQWITGEEFTVADDNISIEIEPVDDELYLYGFWIEDIQNNNYYTDFIEIRY